MKTALEWGKGSASRPGRYLPPGKSPVPIVQEAGWVPGSVWTGAENLAPTGIRSPDRPARSQSLYRLSYPAHMYLCIFTKYCKLNWIHFIIHARTHTHTHMWIGRLTRSKTQEKEQTKLFVRQQDPCPLRLQTSYMATNTERGSIQKNKYMIFSCNIIRKWT